MCIMAKPWKHPDSGIYYLRVKVPADIQDVILKTQIKRSLRTRSFAEAKRLFALQYAETQASFEQARNKISLSPKDIEILAQRWFEHSVSQIEDEGNARDYLAVHDGQPEDVGALLSDALESGYSQQYKWVGHYVKDVLKDNNLLLTEGSEEHQKLTEKLCWRFLELSKLALDRHHDIWHTSSSQYTSRANEPLSIEIGKKVLTSPNEPLILNYTSLTKIVASFTDHKIKRNDWTIRTQDDVKLIFGQLTEYLGAKRDPETITREDLRGFMSLLLKLPKNYNRTPRFNDLSLKKVATIAELEGLKTASPTTVKKKFTFVKSLFAFASQEEWVTKDRTIGLTVSIDENKKLVRVAYSPKELQAILDATRDNQQPSNYWMPRIAALTGMRSQEILQLTKDDIRQMGDTWVVDINDNSYADQEAEKSLKTNNSTRIIPIPETLISIGFLNFIDKKPQGRLFTCVHLGSNNTYSTVYSKRFNTLAEKLDLKPKATENIKKDFHSFRHGFRSQLRAANISDEHANFLGGWADQKKQTAGDGYGRHVEAFIDNLKASIDKVDYEIDFT